MWSKNVSVPSDSLSKRNVDYGSWPCENSGTCRSRRKISDVSGKRESKYSAYMLVDHELENCIFYISPMYEFSHNQGQTQPTRRAHSTARCRLLLQDRTWLRIIGKRRDGPTTDSCTAKERPSRGGFSGLS
jgi:hypothetical protein